MILSKLHLPRPVLVLAAALMLTACPRAPDPVHSEAEIRAAIDQWIVAFNAEDLEGVLESYSTDLILSYPGEEDMSSPERFRDLYTGTFQREGGAYTFAADIEEIEIEGDLAFARVTWTLTWHPEDAEAYVTRTERAIEIWRYEADGVWRLHRWLGFPRPDDL